MGQNWHRGAEKYWEEPGAMAALYVDNHAKEVWTSLFTQSGKVCHLSRVMPCITTTYVHTGAGTPLVASVQSGSAPLMLRSRRRRQPSRDSRRSMSCSRR